MLKSNKNSYNTAIYVIINLYNTNSYNINIKLQILQKLPLCLQFLVEGRNQGHFCLPPKTVNREKVFAEFEILYAQLVRQKPISSINIKIENLNYILWQENQ